MKHHTNDPAMKAVHIANRLEREYEIHVLYVEQGNPYADWPYFWSETYDTVLKELYHVDEEAIV